MFLHIAPSISIRTSGGGCIDHVVAYEGLHSAYMMVKFTAEEDILIF